MSLGLQVAIDCHDVHGLCRFWADVMGYDVEHHDAQIRQLIEAGHATSADTVELDGELWWATAAACRDPGGSGARLLFQQVPEEKTIKNRVHLDVHAGDRRDAVIEWCLANGATRLWEGRQGPYTWVTLADPEGNEFCVS